MFKSVSGKPDVTQVENDQIAFWKEKDVFKRSMTEREGGPSYVFYEGPPTANGRPGSHHVISRAFKDMFPRYKVMKGYHIIRKGGWDTHGLPVEIEVEKELGFEHKYQIEEYGIAEFNKKCKESVLRYVDEWEKLTERIAFWVGLENAYYTFTNDYVQSVWWILQQFWENELLYQGFKVVPYCPRCGTPLSSHEVNLGYKANTPDPSFYVRFKVRDEEDTYFLVWTTTPWTLPGNVALAVGEEVDYVLLEGENEHGQVERVYFAESLLNPKQKTKDSDEDEVHDESKYLVAERLRAYKVVKKLKGTDLVGKHYEPLFAYLPVEKDYAYVTAGEFVSTDDGTGIVHIAPAFGADDLAIGQKYDLPVLQTVDTEGDFIEEVADFAGMWVKDADPKIVDNLESRGLKFHYGTYYHTYPFCWRCDTALLYYARPTWFIRTSSLRDNLVDHNDTINWVPGHVRNGRFGKWLEGNVDWALGRERYWGTPLPVWECDDCGHQHCVGGIDELSNLTGSDQTELDLHRPYVDEITWGCQECDSGTMRRVPELIDVWFDSGAMPYAQWGYPYHNKDKFEDQFPADYICEAVDQTRGWFYSLHAIGTLLMDSVAYKNVICLGHILDKDGRKMSKSRPETFVAPWDVLDTYGADVFRWYMYTSAPPGESRRFSVELVGQSFRSFWTTLWNVYRLFVDYANLDRINPLELDVPVENRSEMDRWILAKLHTLVRDVTEAYEHYDAPNATRPIERFLLDDLSNWYVRRSKQRLWKSGNDDDKSAAYLTLYECLVTLSQLLAPAMPFLADEIYRNLVGSVDSSAPDSVHLSIWPEVNESLIDETLITEMDMVTRLVSLGLAARNSAQIKVRQPIGEAGFSLPSEYAHVLETYRQVIKDELNVKDLVVLDKAEDVVTYSLNPLPQELGSRLKGDFKTVQKLLKETADAGSYATQLLAGQNITFNVNGTEMEFTPQEVEVRSNPAEGYAVASDVSYLAAIKTELSDDLLEEGLAREFIRRVQVLRQQADFNIDDRIVTTYQATEKLQKAVDRFADLIRNETLTDELNASEQVDGEYSDTYNFDDETLSLNVSLK